MEINVATAVFQHLQKKHLHKSSRAQSGSWGVFVFVFFQQRSDFLWCENRQDNRLAQMLPEKSQSQVRELDLNIQKISTGHLVTDVKDLEVESIEVKGLEFLCRLQIWSFRAKNGFWAGFFAWPRFFLRSNKPTPHGLSLATILGEFCWWTLKATIKT